MVLTVADELHHVATVCGHAVTLHGELLPTAAEPNVAPGEVVSADGGLVDAALPIDVVDLKDTALSLAVCDTHSCHEGQ